MERPRFGTDGLRGVANVELTPELATAIGRAAARVLGASAFVVGRDTRQSGPMLQAALSAGMAAEGADVSDLGVLPTGGVAYVAAERQIPAAVVSASHNPYADNGIKLFDARGMKLSPETEALVEAELDGLRPTGPKGAERQSRLARPGGAVGQVVPDHTGGTGYRRHLAGVLDGRRLHGLSVVLDCANGAAFDVAPDVFSSLGASVETIGTSPDGTNINAGCGSTRPEGLVETVLDRQADLGLAFDGDADRLLAVDHLGRVLDGDELLALFATELHDLGELTGNAVVVTVMTNLGFRLAMAARGIEVVETPVGDRHVLAAIDAGGLSLGGEQSGHIVFRRYASTGDGVLTGLLLADAVVRSGRPLAELAGGLVERVPQVLVNVEVTGRGRLDDATDVWDAVARVEAELGDEGRVLLRPSGTEPLVRVMVEAPTAEQATELAGRLSRVVEAALGGR